MGLLSPERTGEYDLRHVEGTPVQCVVALPGGRSGDPFTDRRDPLR